MPTITVAMIEEKEFKTKMRGYDPVEVDEFLDDICDEMVSMQEEIATLKQRLSQEAHNGAYTPGAVPAPAAVPVPVEEEEAAPTKKQKKSKKQQKKNNASEKEQSKDVKNNTPLVY